MSDMARPGPGTGGEQILSTNTILNALKDMTSEAKKKRLIQWAEIRYFVPSEFDSPDMPGSGIMMNLEFVRILDKIRNEYGRPMIIRPPSGSGYRTPAHNKKVGGKANSAHTKAVAVDTVCMDPAARFDLVGLCFKYGIKRIGIAENFIHLDMDFTLPQNVLWPYPKKATANSQKEA